MAIMGSLLLPWHLRTLLYLYSTAEIRDVARLITQLTSALNSSHYFLLFKPPLTPRKGHRKQQVTFGEYVFSPFSCIEWIIQEQSLSETISSPVCRQATAGTLPAWHNWQWTQAILLIDYSDLLMENAKPHCIFHKAPVSNISSQRLPVADPLMFPDSPPGTPYITFQAVLILCIITKI